MAFKKQVNESDSSFESWQNALLAIESLDTSEQELLFNQIAELERSEKTDLLFNLVDQAIVDPELSKKRREAAELETSVNRQVKSEKLQTAVTSYIQEEFKSGVEKRHRDPKSVKIKVEKAVHIYLERAGRRKRLIAGCIDIVAAIGVGLILLLFLVIPPYLFGKILNFEKLYLYDVLPHLSNFVALSIIGWILFSSVYLFSSGQTFGCRQMDIIVVNVDGAPLTLEQSVLRSMAQILLFWTLGLSGLMLWWPPHRALHDHLAGTTVAKFYRMDN